MRSSHSPTIRSRYDYYYSSMSPASSAANFYDNQNQSLFGDPVPPSNNFLETLDNHLYGSFRRNSSSIPPSSEFAGGGTGMVGDRGSMASAAIAVPNDAFIDDFMDAQNNAHHLHMSGNKRKSERPAVTPVDQLFDSKRRSSSSFSDEFRANLDAFGSESEILVPTAPKRLFSEEPINYRNLISRQSSDSLNGSSITNNINNNNNNNEWIRPNIDSWQRDLPPRPTSRNVMNIDHGSAMMAILPDSSTPSSGDIPKSPTRPTVKQIQVLPYQENKPNRPVTAAIHRDDARLHSDESQSSENFANSSSPPKHDISPTIVTNTINTGSEFRTNTTQPLRLHKKTSFTIINELEPHQSRPASPAGGRVSPFRGKGFRAESSRRNLRPVSCPESPRNSVDVETISASHDDSVLNHSTTRPSVHFNIIPPIPRRRSAIQVIDATTADENFNSRESYGDVSYHDRDMESFEIVSNGNLPSGNLGRIGSTKIGGSGGSGGKPSPAPRQHIPRSASSLNRINDFESDPYFGQQQNVNPRSYHKGLLGVMGAVSGAGGGGATMIPSRIPRRKTSISTPNISRNSSIASVRRDSRRESNSSDRFGMRRESSVSPRRHRRVSNEFGGSMIDLGMAPSPIRSLNRISKPTSLSPIVGTPNKDCDQDSDRFYTNDYDGMSGSKYGLDSPTKIPVRRSSSVNIHGRTLSTSRGGSRFNSREPSPMKSPLKSPSNKAFTSATSMNKSPTKIPQKIHGSSPSKSAKGQDSSKSVRKEASSARKEPSSVKKAPSATAKREPSTLKRQNSQQKLKRESSMIDIGGGGGGGGSGGGSGSSRPAKASATRRTPPTAHSLAKNQSDSSLTKRLEKKNSFKQKRRTSSESDGLNEIDTANLSDKLTPLATTIDGISMTTAAVASQPVQITTAVTDHLSKKNSSGQIVNNDNSVVNNDSSSINNISTSNVSEPNANGKTEVANGDGSGAMPGTPSTAATAAATAAAAAAAAATAAAATAAAAAAAKITTTTTTTVIEATAPLVGGNEIAATASTVNLATAKATDTTATISETITTSEIVLESDSAASAATDANANGKVSGASAGETSAVLEKKASTRTLGGKSETSSAAALGTPIVPESIERELIGTPIETRVNVIDKNTLIGAVENDALLMKPNDIVDLQEQQRNTSMSQTHEDRIIETMEKDNGLSAAAATANNIDPLNGAKNELSENGDADFDEPTTCCKLCKCCTPCYASALCLPCRRLKKCSCCKRGAKKLADEQKAAEIATSSILHESEKRASAVAGEASDAVDATADSCWKRMKCCKRKSKQIEEKIMDEATTMTQQTMQRTESLAESAKVAAAAKERGKCALCLRKVFCCSKTNKVQTSSDEMMSATRMSSVEHEIDEEPGRRCCCCLPCRHKKKEPMAWSEQQQQQQQQRRDSLISTTEHLAKKGCCAALCAKLLCCRKKPSLESRRTSMNSKKQSIAPTLPPEDTRPKLDESLIDHTSVMKAAIPVLPIGLAWFCLICNCLVPGTGTLFSGMFCLCLGIPRFSQHDGARPRIGSFVVNTFVGLAQAFTLIFCLVGWGWSIWWGMIMLRTARKHRKLLQANEASMDEEQTIASQSTANQNQRDVEAGRKRN